MTPSSNTLLVLICMCITCAISSFQISTEKLKAGKQYNVFIKGADGKIGPLKKGDTILRKIVSQDKSEPLQIGKIIFKGVTEEKKMFRTVAVTVWEILHSDSEESEARAFSEAQLRLAKMTKKGHTTRGKQMLEWLNQEPWWTFGQTQFGRLKKINEVVNGKTLMAKGEFVEQLGSENKRVWKGGDGTPKPASWATDSIGKDFTPSGEVQQVGQALSGVAHGITSLFGGGKKARMQQLNIAMDEDELDDEVAVWPRLMKDRNDIQALKKRLLKRFLNNYQN